MKLFRMFPSHAHEAVHADDPTRPQARPPEQTPDPQHAQSRVHSDPAKADEMMRLMSERRDRHKKTS